MFTAYKHGLLIEVICFPLIVWLINSIPSHEIVMHQQMLLVYLLPPFLLLALPRYYRGGTVLAVAAGVTLALITFALSLAALWVCIMFSMRAM